MEDVADLQKGIAIGDSVGVHGAEERVGRDVDGGVKRTTLTATFFVQHYLGSGNQ